MFILASPIGDLLLLWIDKVCCVFPGLSFWLHQCGIPHRMCRFYLLLAGAVGKRQGIFDPLSLSNTSPDPLGNPLRRGISAAAGLGQFSQLVSGANRQSPLRRGVWVLCVRAEIVRVSVGLPSWYRSFFIIGWKKDAVRMAL